MVIFKKSSFSLSNLPGGRRLGREIWLKFRSVRGACQSHPVMSRRGDPGHSLGRGSRRWGGLPASGSGGLGGLLIPRGGTWPGPPPPPPPASSPVSLEPG